MASVFSYHTASLRYFGKPHYQLSQSPCACHSFHSPHLFMEPRRGRRLVHGEKPRRFL